MINEFKANQDKDLVITSNNEEYYRYPIKTHVIMAEDKVEDIVTKYAKEFIEEGDIVFIAESVVAIMQKRAILIKDVKPRRLATFLSKFVYKNPGGIGLSMPETMEMALQEVGTPRILWASFASAVGKVFGKRGIFYEIAGPKARDIDGPCEWTLPPYNEYVVLGPTDPQKVADEVTAKTGVQLAIVDINDLGGNVLGSTAKNLSKEQIADILRDNPLGQSAEQTPMGIIRKK